MKVLISTSSFAKFNQQPLEILKQAGLIVQLNPYSRKLSEIEIKKLLPDFELLIAGTEPLTKDVLRSAKNLKIISRCGVGLDNIDLEEAKCLGIKVFNTPSGPTQAVAELTIGLMLGLLRKITLADSQLKNGIWQKPMGNLLQNKKVGIIGFGRIGQRVAKLLEAFGTEIVYYDINQIKSEINYPSMRLEELLAWSDIITIHCSCDKGSESIIGEAELKLMKPGAWLVNTSRGGVVDEEALFCALKEGRLSGAALDVFEEEPYGGKLKQLENVILTPHLGSYAREARVSMEIEAAQNLLKGLAES